MSDIPSPDAPPMPAERTLTAEASRNGECAFVARIAGHGRVSLEVRAWNGAARKWNSVAQSFGEAPPLDDRLLYVAYAHDPDVAAYRFAVHVRGAADLRLADAFVTGCRAGP